MNEITLKVFCNFDEFIDILKNKEFKIIEKFYLDDAYFVPNWIDIIKVSPREILKECIIIREVNDFIPDAFIESIDTIKLTYKMKDFDKNGAIIKQDKVECEIKDKSKGIRFLEALDYKNLINIREFDIVFEKDDLKISVKNVENTYTLMEVEIQENDERYNTIEKLKQEINDLELPIDKSNYFVKKAEIELEKIL